MDSPTQQLGFKAEKRAFKFLQRQGLRIIKKNFHSPFGEIDLIMRDKDTLVFIEVRYRQNANFMDGVESVNKRKQSRIIKSANYFLQKYPSPLHCRFDILALDGSTPLEQYNWIKDAFRVQ